MSQFRKLSQTIWHCQYHFVWVSKYRFRILSGKEAEEVETCIRAFFEQLGCEIIEMNIQKDHVHVIMMVPQKILTYGATFHQPMWSCAIFVFPRCPESN